MQVSRTLAKKTKPKKKRLHRASRREARLKILPELLYGTDELAVALDCSRATAYRLIREGIVRTIQLAGTDRKIPGSEIIRITTPA